MPSILEKEVLADRREACRIPDKLTPSQWAEQRRILTSAVSAEPGPWRNSRTPYLVGIMDSMCEPGVQETVFVKPTQVGGSECMRNVAGWEIDEDPGPCLYVMPTEASVKEALEERIRPLLESTPSLRRHVSSDPHDITQSAVKLDTMSIYFGWSNSPQSLATRPCRRVKFDECDKYPTFAGKEADPISLGEERTATYGHRRHIFKVSTPTTRDGHIWRAWEACGDRRRFHVPCPHCGEFQILSFTQIKWTKEEGVEKVKLADDTEQDRKAWYECNHPSCKKVIRDHHKPKMLEKGVWLSEGQGADRDGTIHGDRPRSKRVGFHLNAIYSPWRSFSDVAAQFIRANGDLGATMNFRNSWLAEPFEQQVSNREPSAVKEKERFAATLGTAGQMRIVPSWCVYLHAIADVQKDHVYFDVVAWGYELQSKRVAVGIGATLDEVYRQVFAPDVPFMAEGGGPVSVAELIVDSGFRKDEVTEFARKDPRRVHLSKGMSTYFGPIAEQKIEKASGVIVWNVNTKQSKDTLDRLVGDPDPMKWQVYVGIGDDFHSQMASEHKIIDRNSKQEVWQQKSSGAANHRWDIESVACAVASARGAAMPKPVEPSRTTQNTESLESPSSNWITNYKRTL
jgi:phage terminase large subunit GpA-like protein